MSLEIEKWATVLETMGLDCYYVAGKLDRPPHRCFFMEEAFFEDPIIREINEHVFGRRQRTLEMTRKIHESAWRLKQQLYKCQEKLQLDLLIAENALTIPMNIPLGIAIVEFLVETRIPCIAHHHDFYWEREAR